jgi:hypothetical protein
MPLVLALQFRLAAHRVSVHRQRATVDHVLIFFTENSVSTSRQLVVVCVIVVPLASVKVSVLCGLGYADEPYFFAPKVSFTFAETAS